jgi:plastocyanin
MVGAGTSSRSTRARDRSGGAALLAVLLVWVLTACGGGAPSSPPDETGSGTEVVIKDLAFTPKTLTVPVGTTVTWTNEDGAPHNVTADDGSFASDTMSQGDTFTQTFDASGTYGYTCTLHPGMSAQVVVE